jgi:hypothetical protein
MAAPEHTIFLGKSVHYRHGFCTGYRHSKLLSDLGNVSRSFSGEARSLIAATFLRQVLAQLAVESDVAQK